MKAYITDISTYLPPHVEENPEGRLKKKTGIARRHVCSDDMTAGDMACLAAENLFQRVDREKIDYILLCTQSPDYFLPSTACILQHRLKLKKDCGALDFDLGCSGCVYGLGLAKGLIESDQARHVLLLTAETYTKYINRKDGATRPLFGDAAAATLIEAIDSEVDGIYALVYGTDGGGAGQLIVPVGGSRNPSFDTELEELVDDYGNCRTNRDLYMNGGGIMNFALEVVPETLEKILSRAGLMREQIDYYVFHQANRFMLNFLQQQCGLEGLPYWNDVSEYGNTVSASIPLAIADMLKSNSRRPLERVMLLGFGVGLSWGGCVVDLEKCRKENADV